MRLFIILLLTFATTAEARVLGFREFWVVQDSLRYLPPNMRFYEWEQRGLGYRQLDAALPDSVGLRLVGKWGAGPSVKVTGRDSVVFLARGSEVVAIDISNTASPRVLSYIQIMGVVSRSVLVGNRLYVGSTGSSPKYIDAFDVSDATNPVRLGTIRTHLYDIDAHDSLVYALDKESLKIYSFADPQNPRLIGACRDSGYSISVCNGYAYLGDRWGLYILDVRNPTRPHRVGSWGTDIRSVKARGNICCVTVGNGRSSELRFTILDVQDPAAPFPLSSIDSCGGYDIYFEDSLVFLSGYYVAGHEFRILSIRDSTKPKTLGYCSTPDVGMGVWANPQRDIAFVADYFCGLATIDIANIRSPSLRHSSLKGGISYDVAVHGHLVFVANDGVGLKILDVAIPEQPAEIGSLDSTRDMVARSIAVADSFTYMSWGPSRPWLRSISVADPMRPVKAGGVNTFDFPADMVLRDSFLYVAQPYRFQVVNVARPREPVLVGTCTGDGVAVVVQDTFVFTAAGAIQIINVARPDSPFVVSTIRGHRASGLAVRATFLYFPYVYDTLFVYSIANPAQPRLLSATPTSIWPWDVVLGEHTAFVGATYGIDLYDLTNPAQPRRIGGVSVPYGVRRLHYSGGLLYAALWEAGVAIYETTAIGIAEAPRPDSRYGLIVLPNPTRSALTLAGVDPGANCVRVYDVTGRCVITVRLLGGRDSAEVLLDVRDLVAGVYFLEIEPGGCRKATARFVKQ